MRLLPRMHMSPCTHVYPVSDCPLLGPRVFGMFRQASDREAVYACFTFSHWLVYANSAANPIIYNFLSGECAGEVGPPRLAAVPGTTACPSRPG